MEICGTSRKNDYDEPLVCTAFQPKTVICNNMANDIKTVPAGSHSLHKTLIIIWVIGVFLFYTAIYGHGLPIKKPQPFGQGTGKVVIYSTGVGVSRANIIIFYLSPMATPNGKKDLRYTVVRYMLQANEIKTFKEIFKILPKSVVAKDLHTNNNRMTRLINDPDQFTLGEIRAMAKLMGVDYIVLLVLIDKG